MSETQPAAGAPQKHLVIASFNDENTAASVLAALVEARKGAALDVNETAIIRKEDDGKLSIKEQNDVNMGVSAAAGGLLGGLLGALLGKPVAGGVLGGLLGAGAAHVVDAGIPDARLAAIGASLPNGASAVAAIVPEPALAQARTLLETKGGVVTVEPIAGGPTVTMPRTGIAQVDALTQQAGEAMKPYVDQAATAISGAAGKVEGYVQQANEAAKPYVGDVAGQVKDLAHKAEDEIGKALKGASGGDPTPGA